MIESGSEGIYLLLQPQGGHLDSIVFPLQSSCVLEFFFGLSFGILKSNGGLNDGHSCACVARVKGELKIGE